MTTITIDGDNVSADQAPWSIRGVPKPLQKRLKQESKRTGQTIGRLLTEMLQERFADAVENRRNTNMEQLAERLERLERKIEGRQVSPS